MTSKSKDPNRIKEIVDLIHKEWKTKPELRLGQLLVGLMCSSKYINSPEVFYFSDEELLNILQCQEKTTTRR